MDTPALSPVETALLTSLQTSQNEHEQRLTALEKLLRQLNEQSQKDSSSGSLAFERLKQQLNQVSTQLAALDARLTKWEPYLSGLAQQISDSQTQAKTQAEAYNQAVGAFNSMKAQYQQLSSEVQQLRDLAE